MFLFYLQNILLMLQPAGLLERRPPQRVFNSWKAHLLQLAVRLAHRVHVINIQEDITAGKRAEN